MMSFTGITEMRERGKSCLTELVTITNIRHVGHIKLWNENAMK